MTDAVVRTRVLLVDDHPLVRAAVRQAISTSDIEVVAEASTGPEAMDLARTTNPDLVLLDIDLPGMSGLEVLRELSRDAPAVQVVILTVSGAHRDLVEAIRLGAAGYLTKDVAPEALLRSVRAARDGDLPIPRRLAAAAIAQLSHASSAAASTGIDSLSERELEVLRLIADGQTDREASITLGISVRTVEAHVSRILRKLGLHSRADAARTYRAGRSGPTDGQSA